jgi:hypothetical protein
MLVTGKAVEDAVVDVAVALQKGVYLGDHFRVA